MLSLPTKTGRLNRSWSVLSRQNSFTQLSNVCFWSVGTSYLSLYACRPCLYHTMSPMPRITKGNNSKGKVTLFTSLWLFWPFPSEVEELLCLRTWSHNALPAQARLTVPAIRDPCLVLKVCLLGLAITGRVYNICIVQGRCPRLETVVTMRHHITTLQYTSLILTFVGLRDHNVIGSVYSISWNICFPLQVNKLQWINGLSIKAQEGKQKKTKAKVGSGPGHVGGLHVVKLCRKG